MTTPEPSILAFMRQEATADCGKWIEKAFSGDILGFVGMPVAVGQAASIYNHLGYRRQLTADNVAILREALLCHLEISQKHSQLWLHPDPDPNELAEIWQRQGESLERWLRFVNGFQRLNDVKLAHDLAFEDFPSQTLRFRDEAAKTVFLTMLKNEQQAFIGKAESSAIHVLEKDPLLTRLEPTHARLLDLLMDGKPKRISGLLLELFGLQSESPENKSHLSRRVSELNQALAKVWGQPPGKQWIQRCKLQGKNAYQLLRGK